MQFIKNGADLTEGHLKAHQDGEAFFSVKLASLATLVASGVARPSTLHKVHLIFGGHK
jgi:hypothetical protein